ncbi:MAG: nucleotidyltransferase family protein [Anaerolineae bacterium]
MSDTARTGLGIPEIIGDKREAILALAARYGASNVRIFGSVARGEADADSDVDILVRFKAKYRLLDWIGLQQALSRLLERRVDVTLEDTLREEFRPSVMRDAVEL